MTVDIKPLHEVTQQAIAVLSKEIGVANTVRFLNQFTTGYGSYSAERETLFGGMTLDQIVSEIKKGREPQGR